MYMYKCIFQKENDENTVQIEKQAIHYMYMYEEIVTNSPFSAKTTATCKSS